MIALTIAGSDSGGGAGIQADLKTFSALGVYGASVVTAITAQNTHGVFAVHTVPPAMVRAQLDAVLSDLNVRAIKIGMVGEASVIEALGEALRNVSVPIVLDPVMVAASGDKLLSDDAVDALRTRLIPLARVVTPNVPEAAVLLGEDEATDEVALRTQGETLAALGPAILMKGGHLSGPRSVDILARANMAPREFAGERIETGNTHGTGCTLSSAIAARLARGDTLIDAIAAARRYLQGAIEASERIKVGTGHGPVHHFHALWERSGDPV